MKYGYHTQIREGVRAYVPHSLWDYGLELEGFVKPLSEADRAIAKLDVVTELLPNPDLFVKMYVRKEAVLSAQIEGTQASMTDLVDMEAGAEKREKRDDLQEISNYMRGLEHGISRLNDLPICTRLIREIHGLVLEGARGENRNPGTLRSTQNWIGTGGGPEDAAFVPPPPQRVAELMSDLERFIHQDHRYPILLRAALVHQQFETIHPFLDGNGRVGRLIVTLMLIANDDLHQPILYLSDFFKRNRPEYYRRLQGIRDRDELAEWVRFFLRGVRDVATDGAQTALEIQRLREEHRDLISSELGGRAANGHILLDGLFQTPAVTVNDVADIVGSSYPAANNLVEGFERLGILEEKTGQSRNRRYHYEDYLNIFGALEP